MSAEEVTEAPAPLVTPGDVLGDRYRIERYLGGGGMAAVYRAVHIGLDQAVAVKVVSPSVRELPGVVSRFMREARAATRLKGEHVVRVFDVGTTADGTPYLVMELLEGKDLAELLEQGFRPSIEDAIDYTLQACEALAEVHGLGIVHRDLKPANVFVTRGPDGLSCLKLIDFGISRVDSPLSPKDGIGLTSPDVVMGSPRYMPPEQMESAAAASHRSDIWGVGAILYELLTGQAPFDGESLLDIYKATLDAAPPAPSVLQDGVPRELDEVVLRCLRVDPTERYADVSELAAALAPFGNENAEARAEAIARVHEAARARGSGDSEGPPALPSVAPSASAIRRRQSSHTRARRLRAAAMGFAATGLLAVGVVARPIAERVSPSLSLTPAPIREPATAVVELTSAEAPRPLAAPAPVTSASASASASTSPPAPSPPARAWTPRVTSAVPNPGSEPGLPRAPRGDDRSLFEERK